ncbi:phage tail tape measure protein [Paenibacillus sp. UNC451MF]|uniref:phage tail tape measure protein n=1 Tax=Paenibacillus sp. UNC451MF TaxID=1449063 RepID=UPI00048E2AE9|nr:phage tail tape measure protein [Paenibacillus sp. UNC451MF]
MAKQYEIAFRLAAQLGSNFKQTFANAGKIIEGSAEKVAYIAKTAAIAASAVAAGAATLGVGAMIATNDYQKAMNKIQMSTDTTTEQMKEVSKIAENLYGQNFGENWDDLAAAISTAKSVTKLQGDELERVTQNALMMRDTFDYDVKESIKATDTMMKNFGVSAEQAYTLLAQGAKQGLNKSDELLDTANEYSVYFKSLGFSANEMFDVFGAGLDAGAFNLDKVGDAVKEFNIRVKDGSKGSLEAFQALGMDADKMAQTFASGGLGAKAAFNQVVQAISAIEDPVKRNTVGVQLMGTQFEDMEAGVIAAMGTAQSRFDGAKDTLQEINSLRLDSPGQFLTMLGRQIQTQFVLPLGKAVMPAFRTFFSWTQSALPAIQQTVANVFQSIGNKISFIVGKLSYIGDAWAVAKSIFSGSEFNMTAWTGLVDKLTALGISSEVAQGFAQMFTRSMLNAKNSMDVFTNGVKLIYSLLGGGADMSAWSAMQESLVKLGMSKDGAYQLVTQLSSGFIKVKETVMQIRPLISSLINGFASTLQQIVPLFFSVASTVQSVAGRILTAIAPVIGFLVSKLLPVLMSIVGFIVQSVIPAVSSAITSLLPKLTVIGDKIAQVFMVVWGVIQPIIQNMITAFNIAFPIIQSVVMNAITAIRGIIDGLLMVLGGVLDFIVGIFTGNWSQAWTGVKDIFSGIFSTLGSVLAFPINLAIDAMNAAIRGMNKVSFDVPDWVPKIGGQSFGVNIPEIAKLGGYADGGIVSSPELAWVGEGGDKEVIVPINNSERSKSLWQTAGDMLGMRSNTSSGETTSSLPQIVYAPQIHAPGATEDLLQKVADMLARDKQDFERMLTQYFANKKRVSYG